MEMTPFVASLSRLYKGGRIGTATVLALKEAGKISEDEYQLIIKMEGV